jgi:hypothetical protein
MSLFRAAKTISAVEEEPLHTFNVRDIPSSLLNSIDRHAKQAKQSRQQYLAAWLERTFGPEGNVTTAISHRLAQVIRSVDRVGGWDRRPTLAAIAESIGHTSTQTLESAITGEVPLSFEEADKICALFGVYREWLLDGSFHPFYQQPKYVFPADLLYALGRGDVRNQLGNPYDRFNIALSADQARVAIYARTYALPWRQDKLMDSFLSDWDTSLICSTLCNDCPASLLAHKPDLCMSIILPESRFQLLTNGESHPDDDLPSTRHYDQWHLWYGDLTCDQKEGGFPPAYTQVRAKFLKDLKQGQLDNPLALTRHIEDRLKRHNSLCPPIVDASDFTRLRTRAEGQEELSHWLNQCWDKYGEHLQFRSFRGNGPTA